MTTKIQQENPKNSNTNWETRLLRFTGFTTPETQYFVKREWEDWWEIIAGSKPENRVENLREGIVTDSGTFENGFLKIHFRQERIDILFEHNPSGPSNLKLETLGSFNEASEHFKTNVIEFLLKETKDFPAFSRIAFGGIIYQTAHNLDEVFDILSNYIECIDFSKVAKSSDFLYQNNRLTQISLNGSDISINRLMKWSALVVRTMFINTATKEPKVHEEEPTCLLEFDVNTHVDNDLELDKTRTSGIFNQFLDLAEELSIKGDSI